MGLAIRGMRRLSAEFRTISPGESCPAEGPKWLARKQAPVRRRGAAGLLVGALMFVSPATCEYICVLLANLIFGAAPQRRPVAMERLFDSLCRSALARTRGVAFRGEATMGIQRGPLWRDWPHYPAVPPPSRFLFVRLARCPRLPPDSRLPATPLPFG